VIHERVELHNVAEVQELPKTDAVLLLRVPESVRVHLNPGAQAQSLGTACSEIRFVADGPVRLTLSAPERHLAIPFHGDFQTGERWVIKPEPTTIEFAPAPHLSRLNPSVAERLVFSPAVRRLMLFGGPLHFHAVEGVGLRPPRPDELPRLRYLAYGTSITHGHTVSGPHLCYVAQAARRLGVDLVNLGMAGSAHCEPELADYMAGREDWHFATLALSVNMVGAGFSLEAFHERVSYMVNTVAGADTARPVACITLFPYFDDVGGAREGPLTDDHEAFRQSLRDAVRSCPHPNAHLIEGPDVLSDVTGLSADLIHPADNGMIEMGENLARLLRPLVEDLQKPSSCGVTAP